MNTKRAAVCVAIIAGGLAVGAQPAGASVTVEAGTMSVWQERGLGMGLRLSPEIGGPHAPEVALHVLSFRDAQLLSMDLDAAVPIRLDKRGVALIPRIGVSALVGRLASGAGINGGLSLLVPLGQRVALRASFTHVGFMGGPESAYNVVNLGVSLPLRWGWSAQ